MPARHFSSVLLPLPLRPAIAKNSPERTSKEMSRSASKDSWRLRRSGCSARSLRVCTRSSGTRKVLLTPSTTIGGGALGGFVVGGGGGVRGGGRGHAPWQGIIGLAGDLGECSSCGPYQWLPPVCQ